MPKSPPKEEFPSVCVVTHPLSHAGENATRTLLEILESITNVYLVTADLPESSIIRDKNEVIEISDQEAGDGIVIPAIRFLKNQVKMSLEIFNHPADIILFFGATSYLIPILVSKLLGRTVLIEPRGDVPLTLRLEWERNVPKFIARTMAGTVRLLERIGFRIADGIITYTPGMATQLDLDPNSGKVYPSGARYVNTTRFKPNAPYEERPKVIGYLGRIDEEKGIRELAEVIPELSNDITFRFIGEGGLREWLEDVLSEEIKAGNVELVGWVDHEDVPVHLNQLKLIILPSHPTEGLPTTILEALACGTPVLATPVSGVPDVVIDEQTGFHIRSKDPENLRKDIEAILKRDDLQTVSTNARELIEENYDFEASRGRYISIFSAVTNT